MPRFSHRQEGPAVRTVVGRGDGTSVRGKPQVPGATCPPAQARCVDTHGEPGPGPRKQPKISVQHQ